MTTANLFWVVLVFWLMTMWQLSGVKDALDKLQAEAKELRKMLSA